MIVFGLLIVCVGGSGWSFFVFVMVSVSLPWVVSVLSVIFVEVFGFSQSCHFAMMSNQTTCLFKGGAPYAAVKIFTQK